jgi:hypothetical protein
MTFPAAAAIALLLLAPTPPEQVVAGVVRGADEVAVGHARVRLVCAGIDRAVETGKDGRFAFERVSALEGCTLHVEQDGVPPLELAVDSANADRLTIRLPLRVSQQVEVVAPRPAPSPSLSLTLTEAEFSDVAATTAQLIEHARQLAGSPQAPAVYVDGLPATTLPPITQIAAIRINADPFSAEYANGDVPTIHIITKAPARVFGLQIGTEGLEFAERNVLDSAARSSSTGVNAIVSGPVPGVPLGFRLDAAVSRRATAMPIRAVLPSSVPVARASTVTSRSDGSSAGVEMFYARGGTNARAVVRENRTSSNNAGVGGLILGEAGTANETRGREIRATVNRPSGRWLHDTGLLVVTSGSELRANSPDVGVFIAGAVTMGGSSISQLDSDRLSWTLKHTIRSTSGRPWTGGIASSGSQIDSHVAPNALGQLQFNSLEAYEAAGRGEPTGTLLLSRGTSDRHYTDVIVAPFVQRVVARTSHLEVVAGVRADMQRRFGVVFSPRVTVGGRWDALTVAFGSGVFARNVSDTIVLGTLERDGSQQQQFLASGVSLLDLASPDLAPLPTLRARLDDGLTRPREILHRVAIERRVGRLTPALELAWARETHRLGSDRLRDEDGWIDVLQSNRASNRQRVLAVLRYTRGSQHLSGSYLWTHARDNGGPGAYTPSGLPLAGEWAPSAGVVPHTITLLGTLRLPGAVSLNVNEMWSSGAPFNITTGLDRDGNGLFVDRGGRRRNSGRGSPMQSLSLYGYKRFRLPATVGGHRFHANLGVQAANLLNTRNVTSFGSVAGSATLGRALAALPGRSVRTFISID